MKNFIEDNPAIVIICMIVFGLLAYVGVGFVTHDIMGMAEVGSKQIFTVIILSCVGCLFTILPITVMYDIIASKRTEVDLWRRRHDNMGATAQAPRRRGESDHWQTDVVVDDDLDGDGNDNDSLRRLGVIQ